MDDTHGYGNLHSYSLSDSTQGAGCDCTDGLHHQDGEWVRFDVTVVSDTAYELVGFDEEGGGLWKQTKP